MAKALKGTFRKDKIDLEWGELEEEQDGDDTLAFLSYCSWNAPRSRKKETILFKKTSIIQVIIKKLRRIL